jgi:CRP/FNR family transcriptional regulator, cyclic AMP receptor protein
MLSEEKTIQSLREITLLREASPALIAEFEENAQWTNYASDTIVVDRSDSTTDVYFVVRGRVKVFDYLDGRPEILVAELGAGDSFGELAAIDLNRRSARVITAEPTVLASMTGEQFRDALIRYPEVAMVLLVKFASIIRGLVVRVTSLRSMTPNQRIYMELLRMAEPNPEGDGSWIIQSLPQHAELADRVGAERETVAQAIGDLARARVVMRKHRSLMIKDYARLQMLSTL